MMSTLDAGTKAQVAMAQAGYRAGVPFNLDAWDGYPAARERLYAGFKRAGSRPLVLSGDSHAFWANNLSDAEGMPVAVEFGTSAIMSRGSGIGAEQWANITCMLLAASNGGLPVNIA